MTAPSGFTPILWALSVAPPSSPRVGVHLVGRVLIAVAAAVDESDHVAVSITRLASGVGSVTERQTYDAIRVLTDAGVLIRTRRVANATEYKINYGWTPPSEIGDITGTVSGDITQDDVSPTVISRGSVPVISPKPEPPETPDLALPFEPHPLIGSTSVGSSSVGTSPPEDREKRFNEFWDLYAHKVARPVALRAWLKAIKKTPPDEVLDGVRRYLRWLDSTGTFKANPATWLNAERWSDQLVEDPSRRTPTGGGNVYDRRPSNRLIDLGPNAMQMEM